MTAGSQGSSIRDIYFQGTTSWRFWDGGNGKYEGSGINRRKKWNNYYFEREFRRRPTNKFNFKFSYSGPTDPNPQDGYSTVPTETLGGLNFSNWPNNLQLKLLNKLYSNIKEHDFNLAVNLGELRQTSSMVTSCLGKLGRSILALKRGDFATAARQLSARPRGTRLKSSDISGRWLELQYGWLPLISDSYEAAKAYEALSKGVRKVRSYAREEYSSEKELALLPTVYGSQKAKVRYRRQITAELSESLSAARSLGLLNPASVAWELLPYSFVVDWFIPIGSYIDLVFTIPNLSGRFMTTDSTLLKYNGRPDLVPESGWWQSIYLFSRDPLPHDLQESLFSYRYASSALQVPLPRFDLSGITHGKRIWNAIALAQQRFAS